MSKWSDRGNCKSVEVPQPASTAARAPANNQATKIIVMLVSPVPAECVHVIVVRGKHVRFSLRIAAFGFPG